MTDEEKTEAIIAAILLSGGKGSDAKAILELGEGTLYEAALLAARRLMVLAQAKTIVPEEHPNG